MESIEYGFKMPIFLSISDLLRLKMKLIEMSSKIFSFHDRLIFRI